jgi:hypothetical protein
MSLIQGTITGLKAASDIAKSLIEIKTLSEVGGKVIELQSAIFSAQSNALTAQAEQASLVDKIRALEEEITCIKAWDSQKQRYSLESPWAGAFVYSLKESMKESEPPHWICTDCYENGKRSIIQERQNYKIGRPEFFCGCGAVIHAIHRGRGYKFEYAKG